MSVSIFPETQNNVRLGFISDLSGAYQLPAESQLNGVTLAVEKINQKGGIAGRMVKVIPKNTEQNDQTTAVRTRELIEKEKVDFVIGGIKAPLHQIINAETKKAGIPFMSIGQTEALTTAEHLGPYTFHQAITPYMTAQSIGTWVMKNIGKKIFLMVMDYTWGWHFTESFIKVTDRMKGQLIGLIKIPFPSKEGDHAKHFSQILQAKPEVLVGANFGQEQINFIKEVSAAGLKRKMSIVNTISETNIMASFNPEEVAGMYWGTTFYWGLKSELETAKHFVSLYRAKFKKIPSGYSAYGYSGTMELLGAAQRIGEYPVNPEKITQEIEGRTYAHYKTREWWRPCDHQAFQDYHILKMKGPEERKDKNDISEIVGVATWDLNFERSCEVLGHTERLWGHLSMSSPA